MNKHRETLRFILTSNMSNRMIGRAVGISHNTVGRYRELIDGRPLDWVAIDEMDDEYEDILSQIATPAPPTRRIPNFVTVPEHMVKQQHFQKYLELARAGKHSAAKADEKKVLHHELR